MAMDYYMIRVFTPIFYTLEFFLVLSMFIPSLILYIRNKDKISLKVFLVAGTINTLVEMLLQGIGTRTIENAYFFTIPIGYPFTCLIMGFFDGGLKNLFAYHTVRVLKDRDMASKLPVLVIFLSVLIVFTIFNGLTGIMNVQGDSDITLTQRSLFSLSSIILLLVSYLGSFSYYYLNKSIPKEDRIILLYYALGLILFLCSWIITAQIFMTRYIGFDGVYPASIIEQILLMWGYFLLFEGVGVSLFIAPVLYILKAFEVKNENKLKS